ncbi:MbtH family NRPS accessory protein [Nocardia sp. NPDC049220]|uniref:MbtH family protein n=1 Tax=Nocardia sp. NPDC049220 TaxID=3155273 RepID=UPI0033F0CC16
MNNPFDNEDAEFYVLTNKEGQHSMWPTFAAAPDGWKVVFGAANRQSCLNYVETHWVDMRPNSLIEAMDNGVN